LDEYDHRKKSTAIEVTRAVQDKKKNKDNVI
jgi:hypothetical protein